MRIKTDLKIKRTNEYVELEVKVIEEKIRQGITGFQWLIMNNEFDMKRYEYDLKMFRKHIKPDSDLSVMKDILRMKPDDFHDKHKINWWIVSDVVVDHMTLLKSKDYDEYFNTLNYFYN